MGPEVAIDQIKLLMQWWDKVNPRLVGVALLVPAIVWLVRGLLARRVVGLSAFAASKLQINISPEVREGVMPAAEACIVFFFIYLSLQALMLPGILAAWLGSLIWLFLVFSVFWLIDAFLQCVLAQVSDLGAATKVIRKTWLPQFIRLLLVVLMLVVILKSWGIDLGPALTGLGIVGAAVALAAQDLIRNLIAGVNIASEKRFAEGDWVNFGVGTDGIVEKLQLRSTVIRKFDRSVIHVPNSELANAPLTNFSSRAVRRLRWKIGVPFDTDPEHIRDVCDRISEYITASPQLRTDEDTHHFVTTFSIEDSWITLLVDCFVDANEWGAELRARNDLVLEIRRVFSEAGVEFAFPSQSVFAEVNLSKNQLGRST